jgi:predicted nucleotidyltransferase
METKQEIIQSLQQHKKELNEKFGIEELALFGSFASDEQNPKSDIDLLVLKMKKKNALTIVRAKAFLTQLLQREVDLGLIDSLRPFIRKRIEKELLYV